MAASKNIVARAYNGLIGALAVIAGAIFGLMAFFIGADVLLRNVTGAGLAWVIEVMEYAMYIATVFAAPWVLRVGAHVCVDVVTANLPKSLKGPVHAFGCILGSAICFVICYYSILATLRAYEHGSQIYKTFTIPEWTISAFVPFGMFLVAIEFLLLLKGNNSSAQHVPAH